MVIQRGSHLLTPIVTSLSTRTPTVNIRIIQTLAGSCNLDTANPCEAVSTHRASSSKPVGTLTYLWSVDTGTILTGQGTDTVEVSDNGSVDSTVKLTCSITDDNGEAHSTVSVRHDRYVTFDSGLFVNGGFEDGINGWLQFDSWAVPADKQYAENPGLSATQILYQNFTLAEDGIYGISATQVEGDAVTNFMINDADSGINIQDGVHIFDGEAVARSTGIFTHTGGTQKLVVDSIKLERLNGSCIDMDLCMNVGFNEVIPSDAGFSSASTYGAIRPEAFLDIPIHSIVFDNISGNCITRMGPDGISLIPSYDEMAWTFSGYTGGEVNFIWSPTNFRYEVTDLALAAYVHTQIGEYMGLKFMPVIFDPLEDSPDWQFIQGDNPESYMYSSGRDIYKIATGSGQENFVAFKPFEVWNDSEISCIVLQDGVSQLNSLFAMVVRGVDINNFIGLRFYANYLDVYERKGGVFKSLNQNPVPMSEVGTNKVTLRVEGRVVTVLINDVERGDYVDCDALDTLLAGYCGIVERPSQAIAIARTYSCVERKIAYVGGNATPTVTYLAFDREPSGLPTSITINAGGVDLTTTLVEQSGSQLVITTAETITTGQTVLATIDGTGSNVPNLTNSFVNNNTAFVTYLGEIVTYEGDDVTYTEV